MIECIRECNIKKLGEKKSRNHAISSSSQSRSVDCINLCFKLQVDVWSLNGDNLLQRLRLPPMSNTIHIIYPQVINSDSTRETIRTELSGWNISGHYLEYLISRVIVKTSEMLKSIPLGNSVLDVSADLCVRRYYLEITHGISGMIPATESSIESLERKTLVHSESCSICFEEISEAVCMPCSHEFHGHCIEKWLRTSHYCPMCRYEMPTLTL